MKLTKEQKKKHVKRSRLKDADEYIRALHKERSEIWEAIDKLPDGVRQEFIKNAGLEQIYRTTGQIVGDHIRETMEQRTKNWIWFIQGAAAQIIQVKSGFTAGEFIVPDEIEDKEL